MNFGCLFTLVVRHIKLILPLNKTTEILRIKSVDQIPTLASIRTIPRGKTLKIIFDSLIQEQREAIGENLKEELVGFQVAIHTIEPEINIAKLITDQEIEVNKDFLEKCAKDYRKLAKELVHKLAKKLEITIDPEFPLNALNSQKLGKRGSGNIEGWRYYLHGFHCCFEHTKTGK